MPGRGYLGKDYSYKITGGWGRTMCHTADMWVSKDCGIFEGCLRDMDIRGVFVGYLEVKKDYSYKKAGDNKDGGAQCVTKRICGCQQIVRIVGYLRYMDI